MPARAGRAAASPRSAAGSNGDAAFVGPNPPGDAVITYYQQKRHIFGDLKIEVLDAAGKLVATLPTQQAARPQPRRLVDAAEAAAGAAGRDGGFGAPSARACCPAPTR